MLHRFVGKGQVLWIDRGLRVQAFWQLGAMFLVVVALLLVPAAWAQNQNGNTRERTESPYFYIPGGQAGVDELPLKNTEVDVRISGVIADVTVVQHYHNAGTQPIEAKYVFPGSTRAAVYGMNVRIGERVITANIREKEQARAQYHAAREEGRTAALLEEHLPNVFQMNVANIMPGDDVRVELHYTELLVPQAGSYQFVFPTVVGPRYNSPNAHAQSSRDAAAATSIPYLHAGQASSAAFSLKTMIVSPLGIKEVVSLSHKLGVVLENNSQSATVSIVQEANTNDRDFILNYRLAGEHIDSGVMLYRGEDENFFLAMVQPPKVISAEMMPPRDYIFVVDTSGSMGGFPLKTAQQVLAELMKGMRPQDTFNVMLFSGSSSTLAPQSMPATQANIKHALEMVSKTYYGSGSTELIPALRHVFSLAKDPQVSRTVVILTDGYVSVEKEAFDLVRDNLDKANVFAFGIGSSVNRYLIEGLARAGMGEPFVVTNSAQAKEQAEVFQRMIASPVLTSVKAGFEDFEVYDVEPSRLPDVLGERPVIVFGKWRGEPTGSIVIEGYAANGPYRQVIAVGEAKQDASPNTAGLRYLWARSAIDGLMDRESLQQGNGYKTQITALGLKYSLLTEYTSFVAVDDAVRNENSGQVVTVNQPSPMPQGVSDRAIAGAAESSRARVHPSAPSPVSLYGRVDGGYGIGSNINELEQQSLLATPIMAAPEVAAKPDVREQLEAPSEVEPVVPQETPAQPVLPEHAQSVSAKSGFVLWLGLGGVCTVVLLVWFLRSRKSA